MQTITLYAGDFGHTINARTYLSDVATASAISIVMKRENDAASQTLTATYTADGSPYYTVRATTASTWPVAASVGEWICQVVLTMGSTGKFSSTAFKINVLDAPSS